MKIGARVKAELKLTEVFPRGEGGSLIFHAVPLASRERFDALVKRPEPPLLERAGVVTKDITDETYVAQMKVYGELHFAFMAVNCLSADEGLVYETVLADKPDTWLNWTKELTEFGLIDGEVVRLMNLILRANALSDEFIDAARDTYFRDLAAGRSNSVETA